MTTYNYNYIVPPLSRLSIRAYAKKIREVLGVTGAYFPVTALLEGLAYVNDVNYDIVDDTEWDKRFGKDKHAQYDLLDKVIYVKESVYLGALENKGRDRFTIAHEIAHALLLDEKSIKFNRNLPKDLPPIYTNPEWQADCLAGELLIPAHLCRNMSIEQISKSCAVTEMAAKCQKSKF